MEPRSQCQINTSWSIATSSCWRPRHRKWFESRQAMQVSLSMPLCPEAMLTPSRTWWASRGTRWGMRWWCPKPLSNLLRAGGWCTSRHSSMVGSTPSPSRPSLRGGWALEAFCHQGSSSHRAGSTRHSGNSSWRRPSERHNRHAAGTGAQTLQLAWSPAQAAATTEMKKFITTGPFKTCRSWASRMAGRMPYQQCARTGRGIHPPCWRMGWKLLQCAQTRPQRWIRAAPMEHS